MTNKKHYRLYVINKIPQIHVLDFQKVKLKVSACHRSETKSCSFIEKHCHYQVQRVVVYNTGQVVCCMFFCNDVGL